MSNPNQLSTMKSGPMKSGSMKPNAGKLRVAVFASGGGSNFEALASAFADSDTIDIALCVSNNPDAGVLNRAERHGIPTLVIAPNDFSSTADYVDALSSRLAEHSINFIALAGYLKMIPSTIIGAFRNRIVNIHPSLLPSFGGKGMYGQRVHRAVVESGAQWSGATVHLVDERYDTGPIVLQEPVPVDSNDTAESLAARILTIEHRIFPKALQLLAENDFSVDGQRVVFGTKPTH